MPNELVPYQGRDDIAFVNRELATTRDKAIKEAASLFRVTDMYVGRCGVLGYVEMSIETGKADLAGILEIPGRLVESMRKVPGMVGYISGVVFQQDRDFTTVYGKEDKSHPSLEGVPLFDSEYYWWPHTDFKTVERPEVNNKIKDLEDQVINFITKFDQLLDTFVPEDRRRTYSSLLRLGPGVEQPTE